MAKITEQNIADAYRHGVAVHSKEISKKDAIDMLVESGMNRKSATMYITCVVSLLVGERYGSTVNEKATEYFLNQIRSDFGKDVLAHALESLRLHLEYQEDGRNNLPSLWQLYERYSK